MPIAYKDFYPEVLESGFFSKVQETMPYMVARANAWIAETGAQVINIETVVLPNVDNAAEASEAGLRTSGEMSSYWHQIVRVWYEYEDKAA